MPNSIKPFNLIFNNFYYIIYIENMKGKWFEMLHIKFEYCDAYTNAEWIEQECWVNSLQECKEIYGLGIDCEYRIISIEKEEE